jgi:endonuclease G
MPSFPPSDFTECRQFFAGGKVPVFQSRLPAKARPLCYDAFAVLHSGATKTPLYVAERINKAGLLDAAGEKRSNHFFADARLPRSERAALDDYKGSGYARGHMAPAANMANAEAMAQSFSLANMVPQAPRNNQGPWAGIEKATRKYAMRASGDVYVITGPVFDDSGESIGQGRVRVPRYLFKLVYDPASQRAWAHWLENSEQARTGRPIEYAELVRRTGIEFLPGLTVR